MKRRDPRKPSEFQIQSVVVAYLRLNAMPGVLFLHVANQQASGPKRGAFLKKIGVYPGASDLLLMKDGEHGLRNPDVLWFEFKAPGQKPTKLQNEFATRVTDIGCLWAWADNVDSAINILKRGGWTR